MKLPTPLANLHIKVGKSMLMKQKACCKWQTDESKTVLIEVYPDRHYVPVCIVNCLKRVIADRSIYTNSLKKRYYQKERMCENLPSKLFIIGF